MTETNPSNATVMDVLMVLGITSRDAASVAGATGLTLDQMRSTELDSIGAEQLRAMCMTLKCSPDELLAIASLPQSERDRRRAHTRATIDLVDAATAAVARVRGVAHLLKQWRYVDGSDSSSWAALDLLADTLEDTADELEQARRAFDAA